MVYHALLVSLGSPTTNPPVTTFLSRSEVCLVSGCGLCHPVPQVSPLVSGDSQLKCTVWDEDPEAVPC